MTYWHSRSSYLSMKVAMRENDLDEAHRFGERAFSLLSPGKPTHAFVAATKYRLGHIRQLQERHDEALELFRAALGICQFNEISNGYQAYAGSTARCKWRISQVLRKKGEAGEAACLLKEAETTKKELYNTGLFVERVDEEESWDSLVALLVR